MHVVSENPDTPLLECKISHVFRCQFKGSHSAALPLSSPKQLAWIGECVTVGTMQGVGREGVVGGACLSRSGDF